MVLTLPIACAHRTAPTEVPAPALPSEPAPAVWCWRLQDDGKVLGGCSSTWSLCEQQSGLLTDRFVDPAAVARARAALDPCRGVVEPWTAEGAQLFHVLGDEPTCLAFAGRPLPGLGDVVCRPSTPADLARLRESEPN